ncbi:MAG: hypothetical protein B7C54_07140 [Acidimicrobiales bacterium mtb01]|nr:hypothetical protein [Actinomycetota bacterium]TEX44913.1 MAG: hypothetical protein B7C54_07140 [Acidimicrobiales bacterium mtb01]
MVLVALVAYVAIVVAMMTGESVARAAAVGDVANNTPWVLPSMPPKCAAQQIDSGNVGGCVISDYGTPDSKGWGTPPFPYSAPGSERLAGWKWLGWSYNKSEALTAWEAAMTVNAESFGRIRKEQLRAPQESFYLFRGFLSEIQESGYRINDAMAYNFRCTSNTRKDCSGLDARSLSFHSWGLAVDINVVANPEVRYYPDPAVGGSACATPMKTDLPQWVVQTAEKWGLLWGGYGWNGGCASPSSNKSSILRDPMHFEFRGTPEQAIAIARFNGVAIDDPTIVTNATGKNVSRIFGDDRFASAAAAAGQWPSANTVFVANGNSFPDSLAAGVAAAGLSVPLLLVTSTSVPESTKGQLARLKPKSIIVAGGPAVVSDDVLAQIRSITKVKPKRIAGDDRYLTAEMLTRAAVYGGKSAEVWVASGRDFQDPLIASSAAAMYRQPFVLIDGQGSLTATQRELFASLGVTSINLVAAPGTVSPAMIAELWSLGTVTTFEAWDVSERSVSVWAELPQTSGVALATSQNFPDALAAVPFARYGSALMLVPGPCVPSVTYGAITRLASSNVTLFGGPVALATPVETLSLC